MAEAAEQSRFQRDHHKRQRDELLETVRKHKEALPKGDWRLSDEDKALYEAAKRIEEESNDRD